MGLFRKSKKAGDGLATDDAPPAAPATDGDVDDDNAKDLAPITTTATQDIVYHSGLRLTLLLCSVFISMFLVALVRQPPALRSCP